MNVKSFEIALIKDKYPKFGEQFDGLDDAAQEDLLELGAKMPLPNESFGMQSTGQAVERFRDFCRMILRQIRANQRGGTEAVGNVPAIDVI